MSRSQQPSHAGPTIPWATLLDQLGGGEIGRERLISELEDRDFDNPVGLVDRAVESGELEAVDGAVAVGGPSRQTNETKSVSGDSERIDELVAEFEGKYPELAALPLSRRDGSSLRRDFAVVEEEMWMENQPEDEMRPAATGSEVVDVKPVKWRDAVRELLESHKEKLETSIHLERGQPDNPHHAEHDVSAESRWMESYQKEYFAELNGWLRELTGGERPSGGETNGIFDDPKISFLSLTASAFPGERRLSPVDHLNELREAWESVYHQLRNTLRSKGYELGEDWQFWVVWEPHTGKRGSKGTNRCYPHFHPIVVVDGEVSASDFRPVIEKHVEECGPAGREAHDLGREDLGRTVEVEDPEEIEDLTAYVADYAAIDPVDLFERSPEFIGYAALMTAANARSITRSDPANAAASADQCKQRYESERSVQGKDHGEAVVRSDRAGCRVECALCGSPHEIDQDKTLSAHRLENDSIDASGGREADLRARWSDATAAASMGDKPERVESRGLIQSYIEDNPEASQGEILARLGHKLPEYREAVRLIEEVREGIDRSEPVGFERLPEWRITEVSVGDESYPANGGGGVDMVEVQYPGRGLSRELDLDRGLHKCRCGFVGHETSVPRHVAHEHGITSADQAGEVIGKAPTEWIG